MSHAGSPGRAYDFLLKFLLVGDSDVGKGEILASLQDGATESPYDYFFECPAVLGLQVVVSSLGTTSLSFRINLGEIIALKLEHENSILTGLTDPLLFSTVNFYLLYCSIVFTLK
uniref:Uncharacterized protein n=1 Tax=Crocodylus porosus TaxID=8502 RepID=A0A7M4EKF6_CROPO